MRKYFFWRNIKEIRKPEDLAKAYLGDSLSQTNGLSWKRLLTICAFYSTVGFSGLFVIPCLGIIAPTFVICAVVILFLGGVKFINDLLVLHIPYVEYISVQFGSIVLTHGPAFIVSIISAIILFLLGIGAWKLLIVYCKKVSQTKKHLSI